MSAHASQAFSIAHYTDSEDLPNVYYDGPALWLGGQILFRGGRPSWPPTGAGAAPQPDAL